MIKKISIMTIKILIILFVFQMVKLPKANATEYLKDIIEDGQSFVERGKDLAEEDSENVMDGEKIKSVSDMVYNTLFAIGIVMSVIVGGILGIQIMWGSIEQQINAKEKLMPYVIGCIVIFGAFGIWKICVTVFSQV